MFYLIFSTWYDNFWKLINLHIIPVMSEGSVSYKLLYQWPESYLKHYPGKENLCTITSPNVYTVN